GFIETAEAGRATKLLQDELPSTTSFTVIFSSDSLQWNDPKFKSAVQDALAPLKGDARVVSFVTPYDANVPDPSSLHSRSGHDVAADVNLKDDLVTARDYYAELRGKIASDTLQVQVTGTPAINNGFNVILQDDLRRAETVSLPIAAILLL